MRDIVFALPKGRLADKTMELLAQIGMRPGVRNFPALFPAGP